LAKTLGLKEAQESVRSISGDLNKKEVFTASFFIGILAEQLGDVAKTYFHGGRKGVKGEDIADIIVCSIAFLNWLDLDVEDAFLKALQKHRSRLELETRELLPVYCRTCGTIIEYLPLHVFNNTFTIRCPRCNEETRLKPAPDLTDR